MKKRLFLKSLFAVVVSIIYAFSQIYLTAFALPADQKSQATRGVRYFDVGCSSTGSPSGGGTVSTTGETTGPPKAVQKVVWDTLTAGGIDEIHTAAIMGSIDNEGAWHPMNVGYFPNNFDGKDPSVPKAVSEGYGLIGWTPGTNLLEDMKKLGLKDEKPYTAETQSKVLVGYLQKENKTGRYAASDISTFLNAKTLSEASKAWIGGAGYGFERPADNGPEAQQERLQSAKRMLRKFKGSTGTVLAATAPGGGSGGGVCCPGSSQGGAASGPVVLTGKTNAEKIFNYLVDYADLTDNQAAGAVGSMMLESGGNTLNIDPTAENPSSHAYGIAQWLGSRKTGLEAFANKKGGDFSDLVIQVQYLKTEMEANINGYVNDDFKKTKTLAEASVYWTNYFEGLVVDASQQLHSDRIDNGRTLLNSVNGGDINGDATSETAPTPTTASGSCECSIDSATAVLGGRLKKLAEENGGKTQIAVSSLDGGLKGDAGGDVQMPTRSSYKIYTAYATLKAIEDGKISWSSNTSWGQSVEATMQAMIINSNNDAAEALRTDGRIGDYKKVTNLLQNQVGLSSKTVMGSGDYHSVSGTNSQSTANDFDKFLIGLEKHKLPGVTKEANYNKLISYMKKATTDEVSARDGIAAGVGSDTEVADKPGWASGSDPASNDVGIVYLSGGTYVLSILTDKPYQWDGIAHIAGEVNKMMGGGSASDPNACAGAVPGDLTATVQGYAWPNYSSSRADPKKEYKQAYDKAVAQGQYGGGGYTDCGAFVTRVMIDSGFEPAYNSSGKGGNTIEQKKWLDSNWQKLSVSTTKDLLPGDVAIDSTHTYMYVGVLSDFHGNSASASLGSRVPMASDYYEGFSWYRKK